MLFFVEKKLGVFNRTKYNFVIEEHLSVVFLFSQYCSFTDFAIIVTFSFTIDLYLFLTWYSLGKINARTDVFVCRTFKKSNHLLPLLNLLHPRVTSDS